MFHCSWRVVAITLTFLTLVLSSVIVYFGGDQSQDTIQAHVLMAVLQL